MHTNRLDTGYKMLLSNHHVLRTKPQNLPKLNSRQFRLWEDMLEKRTGVRITLQREDHVRTQIAQRMCESGWVDPDSYFREVLETHAGPREWGVLLDRLLVKETGFFRHQPSHNFVSKRVASLVTNDRHSLPLNIWSAGCASGEEAYSLAVDVIEGFALSGRPERYSIIGTDVSHEAIARARQGVYQRSSLKNTSTIVRENYFSLVDSQYCKVLKSVRQKTAFFVANLLERKPRDINQMDLIFCQNVLIYFKRWRRRDIVNYFQDCLKPGGCLIIGPGELLDWEPEQLRRIDAPGVHAYEKLRV